MEISGSLFILLIFLALFIIPVIRVNLSPPVARYTCTPSMPLTNEAVSFSAEGSRATEVESSIKMASYEWDFGDGSHGSGVKINHTYLDEGAYEVILVVKNGRGKSDETRNSVVVEPPLTITKVQMLTCTNRRGSWMVEEGIRSSLRRACFLVVPDDSETFDTSLLVDYREEEFGEFVDSRGIPVGTGTRINCSIGLYSREGSLLYEKTLTAQTSSGTYIVHGPLPDLYGNALSTFMNSVYYKYLGRLLATSLGVGDEFSVLVSALQDDQQLVRSSAIDAVKDVGGIRAVEPLSGVLLDDEEFLVRIRAAEALGGIGGEGVVGPLIEALGDEDSLVRSSVVKVLGRLGDERAIEPLTYLLDDESETVRRNAEEALMKIQGN